VKLVLTLLMFATVTGSSALAKEISFKSPYHSVEVTSQLKIPHYKFSFAEAQGEFAKLKPEQVKEKIAIVLTMSKGSRRIVNKDGTSTTWLAPLSRPQLYSLYRRVSGGKEEMSDSTEKAYLALLDQNGYSIEDNIKLKFDYGVLSLKKFELDLKTLPQSNFGVKFTADGINYSRDDNRIHGEILIDTRVTRSAKHLIPKEATGAD